MVRFRVPEMSCGHCRAVIERAVRRADPAARLEVDPGVRTIGVESRLDAEALKALLAPEGCAAKAL